MGGGGSTTSTVTQQNIPKEFFPYFERLLTRGEEASLQPYVPYQGQRLAGQTQDTEAAYGMVRDIANRGTPGVDLAKDVATSNISATGQLLGSAAPYQYSEYGYGPAGTMGSQEASGYMDPYLRNVLDVQKQKAQEDYEMSRAGRNAAAVSAGAFGGSRQQVGESLAERDMLNRQAEIEAAGLQGAYADAVRRYEADRAARMEVDRAKAAELGRVQSGQAGENREYINQQLTGMTFAADQAGMIAKLEDAARAGDIQAAQMLETIGKAQQAQEQAGYDIGYEDFLRQQGWDKEQLGMLGGLLHGLPIANAGETVQQTPYNPIQQALGAGLSALSLYKGFTA